MNDLDKIQKKILSYISHEIRTPLNVLLNYCYLIQNELKRLNNSDLINYMLGLENSSKNLTRTIDLILNMSILNEGNYKIHLTKINLFKIVRTIFSEFSSLAKEKNLSFSINNLTDKFEITADEYIIINVLQNIIDNSIKFTNEGKVTISIFENSNGLPAIKVMDTGIGISEGYMKDLSIPFSQEKFGYSRPYGGTGLGLAVASRFAKLNNAELVFSSKKGEGTICKLLFHPNISAPLNT